MLRYIIFLILLSGPVFGQITQRNLLATRYKLEDVKASLISKAAWKPYPKTPAEWKARVPQTLLDEIVKKGEQALAKEIPQIPATLILEYVRNGDRGRFEAKSFGRRNQLMDLVLAESIENKGRFTDAIANYVWAICEETYWGVPAHLAVQKARSGLPDADDPTVDLFGAETAATLALTDYFVGEKLDKVSPLLRKRIYSDAYSKIFEPIKQAKRYNWLDATTKVNNWNPWIMSNLMTANLLLEPDEAKRAENLYQYMKWLDIYINGLGEDGGCDEGPSYWFAAGGSVFDSLEVLKSATNGRVSIYDNPLIKKMASYIYKMHIADNYFVDFADADPKFSGDGLLLYRFGKAIKGEKLSEFGQYLYSRNKLTIGEGFQKPRRIDNYLTVKDLPSATISYTPVTDAWFSDIEAMTARTRSGLFLASHAGHNDESHNHNDVGDFIVYLGNEPVIIDTGRGNYTSKTFSSKRYELWFTQSEYHNLPIINGFGQKAGKVFTASNVKHSSDDNVTSLSMDISKAYPKEAGINFWNRTVKLDREADTVVIVDDYSIAKPVSLQQVFMTVCDGDISEPGKIRLTMPSGKVVVLSYDANAWAVSALEKPSMEGPEYSSFKSKWNDRTITRIVLTAKNLKPATNIKYSVSVSK
ncbi:MAG TPA: heparinase II/III family protein [Pyrinomonadaceae bacterium]|nr:heparinase II/III family protein [Acidobacteriota bacterium]HQZ95678.1 heparinase II/III family protein [Pyrinomonadaceae bacterium]